jgi:hypothetical protein
MRFGIALATLQASFTSTKVLFYLYKCTSTDCVCDAAACGCDACVLNIALLVQKYVFS